MSEEQQIGFQGGGDEGEMPPEMQDHMLKAFAHAAGVGPDPGKYKGAPRRKRDPDEITDTDMQRAQEEPLEDHPVEAGHRKMMAAATGGSLELGPTPAETQQVKQRGAISQQAATQAALKAQQAQGAQAPVAAPAAPSGPQGVETPLPAQARPQPPPDVTGLPPGEQGQPPAAPGGPQGS